MVQQTAWFYGNDPARDRDFHTIVVNGLPPKQPNAPWLPMLKQIFRVKKTKYLDVLDYLYNNLFTKMPPMRYAVDASRDPTWAELITKKLGEAKTINYTFTQKSKLHLMTLTKNYLLAGYTLPDVELMVRQKTISAEDADNIRQLKQESLREQMKPSTGDNISFTDGGKHNDVLHGQALSLKACYDYQMVHGGFGQHSKLFGFDGAGATLYDKVDKIEKKRQDLQALMEAKKKFNTMTIKYS